MKIMISIQNRIITLLTCAVVLIFPSKALAERSNEEILHYIEGEQSGRAPSDTGQAIAGGIVIGAGVISAVFAIGALTNENKSDNVLAVPYTLGALGAGALGTSILTTEIDVSEKVEIDPKSPDADVAIERFELNLKSSSERAKRQRKVRGFSSLGLAAALYATSRATDSRWLENYGFFFILHGGITLGFHTPEESRWNDYLDWKLKGSEVKKEEKVTFNMMLVPANKGLQLQAAVNF